MSSLVIEAQNIRFSRSYEGLLLHSGSGTQSTCYIVQISNLIPLVGSKRNLYITICIRLRDECPHLHIPGSHQSSGYTIEIYAFIPLVDMECNFSAFLFIRTSQTGLYLKGRLQLFR